jgi:hypothetical protein
LFEKTFSGDQTEHGTRYIDTTKFELVHRPDLYPPEEIVPKWELTPSPEEPQPPRKPLPAKPAKPIN